MKDLILNVISIISLIITLMVTIIFNNDFSGSIFFQIVGTFLILFGLIIWIVAKLTLGQNFTMSTIPKNLITNGIYAKIRHPMYYSGMIIYFGLGLFFKSLIGLLLTTILIVPLLIYSAKEEEKLLIEKYKEKYFAYKNKTLF